MSITFNGETPAQYNIKVTDIVRPLFAERQDHYEKIPGRDGSIVFPQSFGDKTVSVKCVVLHNVGGEGADDRRNIARWLFTQERAVLRFDDEPGVYMLAKVTNTAEIDQYYKHGEFEIEFNCEPFYISDTESTFVHENYSTAASENTAEELTFNNDGTAFSECKIEIQVVSGSITSDLTVLLNNRALVIKQAINVGDTLTINTETFDVLKNGLVITTETEGFFPTVLPGTNRLKIYGQEDRVLDVKLKWTKRFL